MTAGIFYVSGLQLYITLENNIIDKVACTMDIDSICMKLLHCMDNPVLAGGFMLPVQYYYLESELLQDPFPYAL
jgi:hypothetical protein